MSFASGGVSKLEYGSYLAACLAYLAQRQRDRVGIITFDEDIVTHVPPSAKHFNMVLHTLDRARAERPGHLSAPLNKMAEHFKRRGILLLISDFYDEPDAVLDAIKPLRFLGNDLIVFHVLDPQEINFDYNDASTLPGSRERRAGAGGAAVVPRASTGAHPGAHRRADARSSRSSASTTRCSTPPNRSTARSSAICRAARS